MVARSGMFVAPLAGSPPVGMSPTDGRIAFSALIGTTPQPASGGAITQSASTMAITVAAGVYQLPDVSNAAGSSTFLSAVDQVVVTPAAGPATGSRIDLIVVKQNNVENSDADSRVNVVLVPGTAGAPGVAPAVPTGAYLYTTVNVPATVTNAAACTVVVARPTTFAPPQLNAASFAALSTVSGVTGQQAYSVLEGTYYRWSGTAWAANVKAIYGYVTRSSDFVLSGSSQAVPFTSAPVLQGFAWVVGSPTRLTAITAGHYLVSSSGQWLINTLSNGVVAIRVNGSTTFPGVVAPNSSGQAALPFAQTVDLAVGDYIEIMAQSSGAYPWIAANRVNISMVSPR